MKPKRVPLAAIKPDPSNPRKHTPRNLEVIGRSLAEFGQVEPLLVQKGTGRLIAGHGRLAALQASGQSHAWIHEVDVDDAQAEKLAVLLNRTAELAEWDTTNLETVLEELRANDVDLDDLGFNERELEELLRGDQVEVAFKAAKPTPPAKVACPKCGHRFHPKKANT